MMGHSPLDDKSDGTFVTDAAMGHSSLIRPWDIRRVPIGKYQDENRTFVQSFRCLVMLYLGLDWNGKCHVACWRSLPSIPRFSGLTRRNESAFVAVSPIPGWGAHIQGGYFKPKHRFWSIVSLRVNRSEQTFF